MSLLQELQREPRFYWLAAISRSRAEPYDFRIVKIRKGHNPPEVEAWLREGELEMIRTLEHAPEGNG